jgi:hypothetical protein
MAALTGPVVLASGGGNGSPRYALLAFQRVTAADTFDLASLTAIPAFVTVTAALFVATSNRTATTTLCTIATTTATVVGTGIAADSGLMFVLGE